MKDFILSKKGTIITLVSAAGTLIICAIMNFYLIPLIEESTCGIRCFDMNFAYSFESAKLFLSLISERGMDTYLHIQLPLDFIYPLVYTIFFAFLITKLTRQITILSFLPCFLAVLDYTENICTIIMLKSASSSETLASIGSIVTSVKTTIMYLIFVIIIACFVYYLVMKKRSQKENI